MLINRKTGEINSESSLEELPPELPIKDTRVPDEVPSVLAMSAQHRGQRDYLAIGVVAVLIAGGLYVALYVNKSLAKGPLDSITKFMDDITDFGKYLGGETGKQKQLQSKKARKAKKFMRRGHDHYKQKRYKKAVTEYNKALQIDSGNPQAYFWRARCRLSTGQYDKAIADFNKAVKFDPNYSKAYDNLGWLYMKRGEFDKSIGFLNKSIKLKPDNGWAYYTRAHIRIEQGNVEKGLMDANKACKMGYEDGCKIYKKYKQ
jgi:tetratricopeptide (TPR) repeat protein